MCRPPKNRDPEPDEIRLCSSFLHEQISIVGPDVLVALGRFSANMLVGRFSANMLVGLEGLTMSTLRRQDRVFDSL